MKKITIFLAIGFLLFFNETNAQQDPQYTQYMYNVYCVLYPYSMSQFAAYMMYTCAYMQYNRKTLC